MKCPSEEPISVHLGSIKHVTARPIAQFTGKLCYRVSKQEVLVHLGEHLTPEAALDAKVDSRSTHPNQRNGPSPSDSRSKNIHITQPLGFSANLRSSFCDRVAILPRLDRRMPPEPWRRPRETRGQSNIIVGVSRCSEMPAKCPVLA